MNMNLQYFAEESNENSESNEQPSSEQNEHGAGGSQQTEATYTQSDVDSAISKAVENALNKREEKHKEEIRQAVDDAKKDAEAYSKLTQAEKEEQEITKRQEELEARERELNQRELYHQVQNDLKDEQLPAVFADELVLHEDNEKIKSRMKELKETIHDWINDEVKERLRQDTPRHSSGNTGGLTKENVQNMNYTERLQLKQENPEAYNKLVKGE